MDKIYLTTRSIPTFANKVIQKRVRFKNDEIEQHVEDYHGVIENLATMQYMTDSLKLERTINQHIQLCSSISPTSRVHERDYSEVEQYIEEDTNDNTEIVELNFENQDPNLPKNHSLGTNDSVQKQ